MNRLLPFPHRLSCRPVAGAIRSLLTKSTLLLWLLVGWAGLRPAQAQTCGEFVLTTTRFPSAATVAARTGTPTAIFPPKLSGVNNAANLTNASLTDVASIVIGLIGAESVSVKSSGQFPAGGTAGYVLDDGFLSLSFGKTLTFTTWLGGVQQESQAISSFVGLPLLGGGKTFLGIKTTKPFDEIQLTVSLLGLATVNVYYPLVTYDGDYTARNPTTAAPASGSASIALVGPVTTQLPLTYAWTPSASTPAITGLTTGTYSGSINAAVGCLYSKTFDLGEIPCGLTPLTTNNFTGVTVNTATVGGNARTGTYGICVGCSVTNTANVIDANLTNTGNINILAGLVAGGRVSVQDTRRLYSAGTRTGFVLQDGGWLSGALFNGTTIKTYKNDVFQESANITGLFDLPIIIAGYSSIGFKTTKDFDEVQIDASSLAGVLINVNPVYAFVEKQGAVVSASLVTGTTSAGSTDGAISTTVTGGTAPYAYTWNTGANTPGITGLSAGVYSLSVTDAGLCTSVKAFTVTAPPVPACGLSLPLLLPLGTALPVLNACQTGSYTYFKNIPGVGAAYVAINPNGNPLSPTAVTVDATLTGVHSVTSGSNFAQIANRTVSVTLPGTFNVNGGMTVRLYYDPAEFASLPPNRTWFKHPATSKAQVLAALSATGVTGATALTVSASGTENGVAWVEFHNITSFSTFGYVGTGSSGPAAPGCVASDLTLWLKGDAGTGTTTNGGAMTAWADQSGNNRNATTTTNAGYSAPASAGATYRSGSVGLNFNPVVDLTGSKSLDGAGGISTKQVFTVYVPAASGAASGPNRFVLGFDNVSGTGGTIQSGMFTTPDNSLFGLAARSAAINNYVYTFVSQANTLPQLFDGQHVSATTGNAILNGGGTSSLGVLGTGPAPFLSKYRLGNTSDNAGVFGGKVAEVISYSRNLTTTERRQVSTYLAIKYGITLSHDYLSGTGTTIYPVAGYAADVAGVGRDDCQGLYQRQSSSINPTDLLTMGVGGIATDNATNSGTLADDTYLIWGNNGGALTATALSAATAGACPPQPGVESRLTRIWRSVETGSVGPMTIQQAVSTLSNLAAPYYLLVADDAALTTNVRFVPMTVSGADATTTFDFDGIKYFTFAGGPSSTTFVTGNQFLRWATPANSWTGGSLSKTVTLSNGLTVASTVTDANAILAPGFPKMLYGYPCLYIQTNSTAKKVVFTSQFNQVATGVQFSIYDLDKVGTLNDEIRVVGFRGSTPVYPVLSKSPLSTVSISGTAAAGTINNLPTASIYGKVNVTFGQPIDKVVVEYRNLINTSLPRPAAMLIGDMTISGPEPVLPTAYPDLVSLQKIGPTGNQAIGDTITYTFRFNNANCAAKTVSFSDILPAGFTWANGSVISALATLPGTTNAYANTNTLTLTGLSLPPGITTFTADAAVGSAPGVIPNQAGFTVGSNSYLSDDPNVAGASNPTNVTVVSLATLPVTITKSVAPATVSSTGSVTFTYTLNNPTATAIPVELTDELQPDGVTYSGLNLNGLTATTSSLGTGNNNLSISGLSVTPGSHTVTIVANMNSLTAGSYENYAGLSPTTSAYRAILTPSNSVTWTVAPAPSVVITTPANSGTASLTPAISGTATPGAVVVLTGGPGSSGGPVSVTADASGNFSTTAITFPAGPNAVTAVATTAGGTATDVNSFTAIDQTDSDGDGVLNVNDLDDDNDGILDTVESAAVCAGGDGKVNYKVWNLAEFASGDAFYSSTTAHRNAPTGTLKYGDFPDFTASAPTTSGTVAVVFGQVPWVDVPNGGTNPNNGNFTQIEGFINLPCYTTSLKIRTLCSGTPASSGSVRENFSTLHVALDAVGNPTLNPADLKEIAYQKTDFSGSVVGSTEYTFANTTAGGKWVRFGDAISDGADFYGAIVQWSIDGATYVNVPASAFNSTPTGLVSCCANTDTDGDGIANSLDLDSDGDGCADAIEGGASFTSSNLVSSSLPGGNSGGSYTGTSATPVTQNLGNTVSTATATLGIPTVAGAGQSVGNSQNGAAQDAACTPPAVTINYPYNCTGSTTTGTFVANGTAGQTGTVTVPIEVVVAGSTTFTVSGPNVSGSLTTTLMPGQASVTIPITYTGAGAAGTRTLTISSPAGAGTCQTVLLVGESCVANGGRIGY